MLKRTVSGFFYIAIIVGFFLLYRYVDYRLFYILTWFLSAVAAVEVAKVLRQFAGKFCFWLSAISGVLFAPLFFVAEQFIGGGIGWIAALNLLLLAALIFTVFTLFANIPLKNYGVGLASVFYPNALALFILLINAFGGDKGFIALILLFVVSPLSDTFAYLVGMTYGKIRKGKVKKLCPKLSPNKTVAGAIGGLVGGIVGGIAVYLIFGYGAFIISPWIVYISVGLLAAAFTEGGDLLESLIKRRAGVKDMGKIMPGHGGIADRIDGTVLAAVIIFVSFAVLCV